MLVPALAFAEIAFATAAMAQSQGLSIADRITSFRGDAEHLRQTIEQDEAAISAIEQQRPTLVGDYSASVSTIDEKLSAGTTPGNPDLVGHWQAAQTDLGKLDQTIGGLSSASGHLSEAAALAAYLQTSVQAAAGLPGANDSQHQELLALQQVTADTSASLKHLVGQIGREIEAQSIALGDERRNLLVLRHAIEIGAPLGNSLANGGGSRLAALRAPGPMLTQMAALPQQSTPSPEPAAPTQIAMSRPAPTPAPMPEPEPTPAPIVATAPQPVPLPPSPAPIAPAPVAAAPVTPPPAPTPVVLEPAPSPKPAPDLPPPVTSAPAPAPEQTAMLPPAPPPKPAPAMPSDVERPLPSNPPIFVVGAGQAIDQYESKLYESISKVLDRKPNAVIQIFAVASADDTDSSGTTRQQAHAIADALDAFGIPSDHVSISSSSGAGSKAAEVRIYAP